MKIVGHFSRIGWMAEREEYEVLWFPEFRMEAVKILCEKDVHYSVRNGTGENMCTEGGTAGSVGRSRPVYAVLISCESREVYYRVWLKNIGWTAFHKNGEWCGNLSETGDCTIGGIQFFLKAPREELQDKLQRAEEYLNSYQKQMNQLFLHNSWQMLDQMTRSHMRNPSQEVVTVENGFLLPLRKSTTETAMDGVYCGGVADSGHGFVAGLERTRGKRGNFSCTEAYDFSDEDAEAVEETVIFGGVILKPFGHLMAESLSRFWYMLGGTGERIVVLSPPGQEGFSYDYFELMGIAKERIAVVTKLTKFSKIIVPAQSICFNSDYTEKYITIYDAIRKNVEPAGYDSIYLTRADFERNDGVNEKFLESFYERRGYKIISPEKYSIREQAALMGGGKTGCLHGGNLVASGAVLCASHGAYHFPAGGRLYYYAAGLDQSGQTAGCHLCGRDLQSPAHTAFRRNLFVWPHEIFYGLLKTERNPVYGGRDSV